MTRASLSIFYTGGRVLGHAADGDRVVARPRGARALPGHLPVTLGPLLPGPLLPENVGTGGLCVSQAVPGVFCL